MSRGRQERKRRARMLIYLHDKLRRHCRGHSIFQDHSPHIPGANAVAWSDDHRARSVCILCDQAIERDMSVSQVWIADPYVIAVPFP